MQSCNLCAIFLNIDRYIIRDMLVAVNIVVFMGVSFITSMLVVSRKEKRKEREGKEDM